mgnify:FL=1
MWWRSMPQSNVARRVFVWTSWAVVIWVTVFWRLGFPSFWDPDEAVYAVASREMLRTGDWLAPMFNGAPFFDKPILFYWLQLLTFKIFGVTEFAARLVPAVSAVGVIGATFWAGRTFFNRTVAHLAALFVAILPATFALSAYAILDMTFTALLFAGVVLAASAAVHDQPRRQWWGYLCLALAVLTKGPLAIALAGLTFFAALVAAPSLRAKLLGLRWVTGFVMIVAVASPWFLYMWLRFGHAFIEGYFLRENIWLYSANLFTSTRSTAFYLRVLALGMLPWTPIVIGRLIDAVRGDRIDDHERLFWCWSLVITVFFTLSRFKLDHYIYPVLPALCLIAAHTWWRASRAEAFRTHAGAIAGIVAVAALSLGAGVWLWRAIDQLPLEFHRAILLAPLTLGAGGAIFLVRMWRRHWRPPVLPTFAVAGILASYGVVLTVGLDALERAKPVKDLASWVSENAPADATMTAYQLERWRTSWRFYDDRPLHMADTPEELLRVMRTPGTHYAVMLKDELDAVRKIAPEEPLHVVRERKGLTNTSGRGLRKRRDEWPSFVVVTNAPEIESNDVITPAPPAGGGRVRRPVPDRQTGRR